MTNALAVLTATLQYALGIFIFKKPDPEDTNGLYISLVLGITSMFLILWSVPLYPEKFRKMKPIPDWIVQHLAASFILEYFMAEFWFPLESKVMQFFPWMGGVIHDITPQLDETFEGIFGVPASTALALDATIQTMNSPKLMDLMSATCGLASVVTALHATNAVDFSIISKEGYSAFFTQTLDELTETVWKTVEIAKSTFLSETNTSYKSARSNASRRSRVERDDDEYDEEISFTGEPMMPEPGDGITEYHLFRGH